MNEIILKNMDGQPMADSRDVAWHFGKQHKHLLDSIKVLLAELQQYQDGPKFRPIYYIDSLGRKKPCYLMNRDAFALLVMRFTGQKALQWQIAYIEAFNKMETALQQHMQPLDSYMIEDPRERAKRWLEELEEKEALESLVQQKDQALIAAQPKIEMCDAMMSIDGGVSPTELCRIMGIQHPRKTFIPLLKKMRYLRKNGRATMHSIERGVIRDVRQIFNGEERWQAIIPRSAFSFWWDFAKKHGLLIDDTLLFDEDDL